MSVSAVCVREILETTVRFHRLDADTMVGPWWETTASDAVRLSRPDEIVDFLKATLRKRQRELAAARWYEQN